MGVLDTFFILFKSDAKEVEEGADKATKAGKKLEKELGGVDKASAAVGKKFLNLATTAVASFASVFAVTQLISSAQGIATQSQALGLLGEILGESTAEIINWGRAVEGVGGSSQAFQGSLRSLNSNLNDVLFGSSEVSKAFGILGISAVDANGDLKTSLDLLPEIARAFEGLERPAQQRLGAMIGLDEGTILLLSRGEAAVAGLVARQRELNRTTDAETASLRLVAAKWQEYKNLISDIATDVLVAMLPMLGQLEEGLQAFVQIVSDNKDFILTFFIGLGVILAALAIKALILAIPFILTAAAIGAVAFGLGVLAQDLFKFFNGQDSFIGRAIDQWQKLREEFGLIGAILETIKMAWEGIKNVAESFGIPDFLSGLPDQVSELLGFGQTSLALAGGAPIQALGAANAAQGAAGSSTRTNTVTVEQLTVETQATDAEGIAAAIGPALENEMQNAVDVFDDGQAA